MGGTGSGLNRVNPAGEFCDVIEESLFSLVAAEDKFLAVEGVWAEALADLRLARQVHEEILRANGYKHLTRQGGLSIAVAGSPRRLSDSLRQSVREKRRSA